MVLHQLPLSKHMHDKGLLPPAKNTGGIREFGRCWTFSCLDLIWGFWQIKIEEVSKQDTAFTVGNFGLFACDCMPFGLCNALVTFQRLMQNCLGELNLIYCLIYLHNVTMFLQTAEEHLHRLYMVFDWFWEYNLKLKPSKCSLFKEEINYLAYRVSKQGVQTSDLNLMAITECALPQTYTEIHAFLGLMGHSWWFIKGFTQITQPLNKQLPREGTSRKTEWVSLSEDVLGAFQALKQACMNTPVLAFADYTKDFYSKQMLLKREWEWYFPKNKPMGNITQSSMVAEPSLFMKRTIILPNLSSLHWNGPLQNISRNTCCTSPS